MKIAIISPYHKIIERGAEQFADKIQFYLEQRGHTIDIINIHDVNLPYVKQWEDYIANSPVGSFFKKFVGFEPSLSQIPYAMATPSPLFKNYDILWSNAEFFSAVFCYKFREEFGVPFMVSSHSNPSQLMKSIAMLKPDLYTVLTPNQEKYLSRYKCNVKFIPAGIDTKRFKSERKQMFSEFQKPIYLSTSALVPAKRIELIINAISELKRGSFIFTSDGFQKEKLLSLCAEKLKGRYKHIKIVKDMPAVYNSCDYYVSASMSEGLSTSISEAMACNLPIVYNEDKDRNWQVGKAGIPVNVTDKKSFVEVLKLVTKTKFNYEPRQQALQFDWKNIIDQYEQEIKKVLN